MKVNYSYIENLIETAEKHEVEEYQFYRDRGRKLTIKQLELILLKSGIELPKDLTPKLSKSELKKIYATNLLQAGALVSVVFAFVLLPGFIQTNTSLVKSTYTITKSIDSNNSNEIEDMDNRFFSQKDTRGYNTPPARSLLALFEELKYDLKEIRNGEPVKPVFFTQLPRGINELDSISQRKQVFIQVVLPLVLSENQKILLVRKKIKFLANTNSISQKEKKWLEAKFKQYRVKNNDINELLEKVDIIPPSIAIAQAAYESGWGTSRFALEGNSLFGQRTWRSGSGFVPKERSSEATFEVTKFQIIRASVKAYKKNLNTHKSYKKFRELRAEMRSSKKEINGIKLSNHLTTYSEIGEKYVLYLKQIIDHNSLTDFDKSILLPTNKHNQA